MGGGGGGRAAGGEVCGQRGDGLDVHAGARGGVQQEAGHALGTGGAHVARGGPSGGDGGDGGDVVFVGDDGVGSLLDFKFHPRLVARNGEGGRGKKQAGHFGPEVVARVPLGTQIFDADTDSGCTP